MKIILSNNTTDENTSNFDVVSGMTWVNNKGYEHSLVSVQGVRSLEGDRINLWISVNITVALKSLGEELTQEESGNHVYAHGTLEMVMTPAIQTWLNQLIKSGYQIGTRIKLEKGSVARLGYIQAEAIALETSSEPRTKNGAFYFVIERIGSVGSLQFTAPSGKLLKNEEHDSMKALIAAFS